MTINDNTGLVLEGGGMRGVFTSGVLDAFMKHGVTFNYIVAVSAGACNGMSYMSHQPGRARFSNIDMLKKYDYIGLRHLFRYGSIFDPVLLYDRLPNELYPYDWDAYYENPATYEMVVTHCQTGRCEYLSEHSGDNKRLMAIVQATSSLPIVSNIIDVDGKPMLDGGIIDSIPIERAIAMGHETNIVVCTRERGFRNSEKDRKIPKFIYKRYPRLRVALSHRVEAYNQQLALVERLEDEGRIICIRPEGPVNVGRAEKDIKKLENLYAEGLRLGEKFCEKYKLYCQGNKN